MLAEAATGTPVFGATRVRNLLESRRPPLPDGVPAEIRPLVSALAEPDPADRPASARDALDVLAGSPSPRPPRTSVAPIVRSMERRRLELVGRDEHVREFAALLAEVMQGQRHVVMFVGEPGIGKTTLARECLRRSVAAGALVAEGRCFEHVTEPYQPLLDVLRVLLASRQLAVPAWLRSALLPVAALAPELRPFLDPHDADRPPVVGIPERVGQPHATARALAALFACWAAQTPIVLLLDDLQWADADSLEVLRSLVSTPPGTIDPPRLCIVATARDVELDGNARATATLLDLEREEILVRRTLGGHIRGDAVASAERLREAVAAPSSILECGAPHVWRRPGIALAPLPVGWTLWFSALWHAGVTHALDLGVPMLEL